MNKQKDRLMELLENHCDVAECKAHSQDCTAEDCASCLADYILADGWMRPPCKVGDTIYKPIVTDDTNEPAIWEIIITRMEIDVGKDGVSSNSFVIGHLKNTQCGEGADFSEFGKTVFLTKEEAEKALGGVQG